MICFGEVIDPLQLRIDKHRLTVILRDELASLKWRIWERRGICKRDTLTSAYWDEFIRERRFEWCGYSMKEQIVNTYIPKEKWEYWQIQRDLRTGNIPLWYQIYLEEYVSDFVFGEIK